MVRSSQPPLPSLGAEVVTLGLSVDKGVSEPQAIVEVIEPRKSENIGADTLHLCSRQNKSIVKGKIEESYRGLRAWRA